MCKWVTAHIVCKNSSNLAPERMAFACLRASTSSSRAVWRRSKFFRMKSQLECSWAQAPPPVEDWEWPNWEETYGQQPPPPPPTEIYGQQPPPPPPTSGDGPRANSEAIEIEEID